jgi:hypothetical protein
MRISQSWARKQPLVPLVPLAMVLVFTFASCCWSAPAFAAPGGSGWQVFGYFEPTNLKPGSTTSLVLSIYSVGAQQNATPVRVVDRLPTGWTVASGGGCKGEGTSVAVCELPPNSLPAGANEDTPTELGIRVNVPADASSSVDHVEVSGGGASEVVQATVPATVSPSPAKAGLANVGGWITNRDGTADRQAGSHPYLVTVVMAFNSILTKEGLFPAGEPRTINVKLPAGFVGDPESVPQCTRIQFEESEFGPNGGCPPDSMVGEDTALIAEPRGQVLAPVYNLVPPKGVAAEFAFSIEQIDVFLDARVRTGGDDGITIHVNNVPQKILLGNSTTFWGVPGEESHDFSRGEWSDDTPQCKLDGKVFRERTGCSSTDGSAPFLSMPTSCGRRLPFTAEILSTWQEENIFSSGSFDTTNGGGEPVAVSGCEKLVHFEPKVEIAPDTQVADTAAGLTTDLHIPQGVNPEELATSGLRDTTVVLPEGMAINPGQATGLTACKRGLARNSGETGFDSLPLPGEDGESEEFDGPPSCPSSSKVGTVEVSTPLLADRLVGSVYVLPSNPPNLELLVAASGDGVNVKLVGKVHLDQTTGRLTATFDETPDFPVSEFKLSFSGGAQAALVTPPNCGEYETSSVFVPWSAPNIESAFITGRFVIASRPEGVSCSTPMGFSPTLTAGATTDQAGGYTDFSMLLQRADDQQRIRSLSFKAPPGLSGMIAKVPLCQEPQAAQGTCSAASQIGHSIVGAGPGPYPLFVPQAGQPPAPIYLTGPYKGAPFGLSIVVPIVAGPFTLETQVVRAKIEINPYTAQITITTDPLPTIIDGIPADLRSINAVIDRPGFMFNPTDCNPSSFSGTATSTQGTTVAISSPFQVGSCRSLTFKPDFKVSTSGKNSKADGASLSVKIVYPSGELGANQASSQSNIASVKVDLPKQLPSRLTTLQKACPSAQFEANPAGCPAVSVVGHATVITPILPVPLQGPAYFVSHGGEAFPSLVVVLQGYGVTVDLVGTTFISKASITSSTFKATPDVPFTSFELVLPQGKYSALSTNLPERDHFDLCGQKLSMPTVFTGQNGAVVSQSTPVSVSGCTKAKAKAKKKRKKSTKRKRSRSAGHANKGRS